MAAFKVGDRVRCVIVTGAEDVLSIGETYRVTDVNIELPDQEIRVSGKPGAWLASRFEHYANDVFTAPSILVPVDPKFIPSDCEAVAVRAGKKGELHAMEGRAVELFQDTNLPHLIVRRKYEASVSIPKGWWVAMANNKKWFACDEKPVKYGDGWRTTTGNFVELDRLNFVPPLDGQPRQVT